MEQRPLPTDWLEAAAEEFLTEPPYAVVDGDCVDLSTLHAELDVIENAAEREYENDAISAGMRNGALMVVAGLRHTLEQAETIEEEQSGGTKK